MLVIGLAGGSGSGKGVASQIFASYGFLHIDTDRVYHDLISGPSPCLSELVSEFGGGILAQNGALDRKKLAAIVFSDRTKLDRLNSIAHRHILKKTREIINSARADGYFAVLVDAPLLFESGFDKECDLVISLLAKRDIRICRIIARDGISSEKAAARIDNQLSDGFLTERSDYIIENNGTTEELSQKIDEIINELKLKG